MLSLQLLYPLNNTEYHTHCMLDTLMDIYMHPWCLWKWIGCHWITYILHCLPKSVSYKDLLNKWLSLLKKKIIISLVNLQMTQSFVTMNIDIKTQSTGYHVCIPHQAVYHTGPCKCVELLNHLQHRICPRFSISWMGFYYDVGSSPALVHGPGRTFTQPHGTLGNQNAQLLSERPIHEKRNVQLTTFWSKWRKKQAGVLVWCWITNIYWGIYGDNHAHGTRKHFGKGLVTGRQDSRHTVFLVVCAANATSCYRHIW